MATKVQVYKLADKLGVEVTDGGYATTDRTGYWDTTLDAPIGSYMLASDCHCCVIHQPQELITKAEHWDAVFSELNEGIGECDSQCEVCEDAREELRKEQSQ